MYFNVLSTVISGRKERKREMKVMRKKESRRKVVERGGKCLSVVSCESLRDADLGPEDR